MSIKLLVADDSITIQKVIGIIFGGEDYSLTVVDNGRSAIEKAREICPDVLLIDALMPGMTGYEVAEAVRATPALAHKPILILTGSFEPFDEEKARKSGADDFLAKPFESQQIVNKVRELAELGASRQQAAPAPQPAAAVFAPAPPVIPAAIIETEAPGFLDQPTAAQSPLAADIWGAFTTESEAPSASVPEPAPAVPPQSAPVFEFDSQPDVFAIVNEEDSSQLLQPAAALNAAPQNTGSQWIPVEEHTFEFEEETVSDIPAGTDNLQAAAVPDYAFGDITFEDDSLPTASASVPVPEPPVATTAPAFVAAESAFAFDEPAAAFAAAPTAFGETPQAAFPATAPAFSAPPVPPADPRPAIEAAPAVLSPDVAPSVPALTEEQLKAAISAASKEVIERIVWEVVPDLAEALIKEAIRKIREDR